MSHNHPITETSFSFSEDDMASFMDYDLDVLRGCDERYTYEFTRNAKDIDELEDKEIDLITYEEAQHFSIIQKAKIYGIGYRRWKNE